MSDAYGPERTAAWLDSLNEGMRRSADLEQEVRAMDDAALISWLRVLDAEKKRRDFDRWDYENAHVPDE